MNTLIEKTIVRRLLVDYLNECGDNYNPFFVKDISLDELQDQLVLLDEEYSEKIIKAVLE